MRAQEFVSEKWSAKYKRSIDCSHPRGFSQRAHCQGRKKNEDLTEFAPSDDNGDNEPDEYEILHRLAAMWWLGTEQQMIKAQRTLQAMGWEIGEDEGYDDGGVFVVRAGDEHGKSYISWPHEDLQLNEQGLSEEQLDELTFKGSPCTKDCSGHRAGYEWSRRKGGRDAASWSRSFNNGAALFKNGY